MNCRIVPIVNDIRKFIDIPSGHIPSPLSSATGVAVMMTMHVSSTAPQRAFMLSELYRRGRCPNASLYGFRLLTSRSVLFFCSSTALAISTQCGHSQLEMVLKLIQALNFLRRSWTVLLRLVTVFGVNKLSSTCRNSLTRAFERFFFWYY